MSSNYLECCCPEILAPEIYLRAKHRIGCCSCRHALFGSNGGLPKSTGIAPMFRVGSDKRLHKREKMLICTICVIFYQIMICLKPWCKNTLFSYFSNVFCLPGSYLPQETSSSIWVQFISFFNEKPSITFFKLSFSVLNLWECLMKYDVHTYLPGYNLLFECKVCGKCFFFSFFFNLSFFEFFLVFLNFFFWNFFSLTFFLSN